MSDDRLARIEQRVEHLADGMDQMRDVLQQLVRIEERQAQQIERVQAIEKAAATAQETAQQAHRKIDLWVNRGIGLWGAAMLIWTLVNSNLAKALAGGG